MAVLVAEQRDLALLEQAALVTPHRHLRRKVIMVVIMHKPHLIQQEVEAGPVLLVEMLLRPQPQQASEELVRQAQ
jgi:hypothetical protein